MFNISEQNFFITWQCNKTTSCPRVVPINTSFRNTCFQHKLFSNFSIYYFVPLWSYIRWDIKTVRAIINQWVYGAYTHFSVFSLNDIDLRKLQMYMRAPKAFSFWMSSAVYFWTNTRTVYNIHHVCVLYWLKTGYIEFIGVYEWMNEWSGLKQCTIEEMYMWIWSCVLG